MNKKETFVRVILIKLCALSPPLFFSHPNDNTIAADQVAAPNVHTALTCQPRLIVISDNKNALTFWWKKKRKRLQQSLPLALEKLDILSQSRKKGDFCEEY